MAGRPPTTWEAYAREMGLLIQKARIEAGLTQEDLAHRAGLTRTHFQQIERGWWKRDQPANPSVKVIVRLAQALETDPSELLPAAGLVDWD